MKKGENLMLAVGTILVLVAGCESKAAKKVSDKMVEDWQKSRDLAVETYHATEDYLEERMQEKIEERAEAIAEEEKRKLQAEIDELRERLKELECPEDEPTTP